MKKVFLGSLVAASMLFLGCGEGACCQTKTLVEKPSPGVKGNIAPIANFQNLALVSNGAGCVFSADGSLSHDTDGGTVETYAWKVNGASVSTMQKPATIAVPCELNATDPIVCLTVTDNQGAQSLEKCTTVKVTTGAKPTPPAPIIGLKPPTAIITFSKVEGEDAHQFHCNTSHENDAVDSDGNPANDKGVVSCHWVAFKTTPSGGTTTPHTGDFSSKWVDTSDEFDALHITLTVTDDDNQTDTVTKSYILATDLD